MVEVDLRAAFGYPWRGEGAWKYQAVGGGVPALLVLATFALWLVGLVYSRASLLAVPLLPLQLVVGVLWTGYFVRVARRTVDGSAEPPALDGWWTLLRDGLGGTAVAVVYALPGLVLTLGVYAVMFASVLGMGMVGGSGPGAGLALGLLGVVAMALGGFLVLGYAILAAYLLPASLTVYAVEGSVRGAFAPGRLRTLVTSGEFAVPWALVAGAGFVTYAAVSFLTMLLVGYLLVPLLPLVFFYLGTVAFHAFGQAHGREVGSTWAPSEGTTRPHRQEDI